MSNTWPTCLVLPICVSFSYVVMQQGQRCKFIVYTLILYFYFYFTFRLILFSCVVFTISLASPLLMDPNAQETLEKSLDCILDRPHLVTQELFITAYNTVYLLCAVPSETYHIKGEEVYNLVEMKIEQFTRRIPFTASITSLAKLMSQFKQSSRLLSRIFRYLERYFIRITLYNRLGNNILRGSDDSNHLDTYVEPLSDMFFRKLYFNFIFNCEEKIQTLIFAELNFCRMQFKQSCPEIHTIVSAYISTLLKTNQEESLNSFYERYVHGFVESTDFTGEIGKLLKRVYLEMFYAANIIGDKSICREIVLKLTARLDDLFSYAFAKIRQYESAKHIFKIVNVMGESSRIRLRSGFESIVNERLQNISSFSGLYEVFTKTRRQIDTNKMGGWSDLTDKLFQSWINTINLFKSTTLAEESVILLDQQIKLGSKESNLVFKLSPDLLDLVVLFNTDLFIDLYTKSCQIRLLNGCSAHIEQYVCNELLSRLGLSSLSILSSSINTYLEPSACLEHNFKLFKHTAGFWPIKPVMFALTPELTLILNNLLNSVQLGYREKLSFNLRLSSITIRIYNKIYKMNTDTYMVLSLINSGNVNLQKLLFDFNNVFIEQNLSKLVSGGLIKIENENIEMIYDKTGNENDLEIVDLFEVVGFDEKCMEESENKRGRDAVCEAAICRLLKRVKKASIEEIAKELEKSEEVIKGCLYELETRGYVAVNDNNIEYVP